MLPEHDPIEPKERLPVFVFDRWNLTKDGLMKSYKFQDRKQLRYFISSIIEYEEQIQHSAKIDILGTKVGITIITETIEIVTEIDKEYARYVDVVYRDVMQQ